MYLETNLAISGAPSKHSTSNCRASRGTYLWTSSLTFSQQGTTLPSVRLLLLIFEIQGCPNLGKRGPAWAEKGSQALWNSPPFKSRFNIFQLSTSFNHVFLESSISASRLFNVRTTLLILPVTGPERRTQILALPALWTSSCIKRCLQVAGTGC